MILQTRDDKVTIKWYNGSWSRKWKVYTYKNRNSESVASVEILPPGDIIIGEIELTKSCSLPKATNEKIRDLYNSLDNTGNYLLVKSSTMHFVFSLSTSQKTFPSKLTFHIRHIKLESEVSELNCTALYVRSENSDSWFHNVIAWIRNFQFMSRALQITTNWDQKFPTCFWDSHHTNFGHRSENSDICFVILWSHGSEIWSPYICC